MAEPNSKATLKEYVKRRLGAPVLEINVDDDQFVERLEEGLQYLTEQYSKQYVESIDTQLAQRNIVEQENYKSVFIQNSECIAPQKLLVLWGDTFLYLILVKSKPAY